MSVIGSGVLRRWAVIAAWAALSACVVQRQVTLGQTQVGQGLLYQSSNLTYDKFFEEMHAVQLAAMGALDEESKARAPLEQALTVSKTTLVQLADLAKARAKKNEPSGAQIRLAVTGLSREKTDDNPAPVSAVVSIADDSAVAADDRDFIRGLDQSVKSEAELAEKYAPLAMKARKLSARSSELLGSVNADFTRENRRSEVSEELGAAKLILDAVADRSDKISSGALSFLKVMADAFPPPGPPVEVAKVDASKTKPKKNGSKPGAAPKPKADAVQKPKPEATPPKPKPEPPSKPKPEPVVESSKPAPKPAPPPAKAADDFNP
jgi:hypothetical protein